ncbi:MAG: MATE family efflux transporter [Deltaproteobacteria bacterium]|nr:MATE family efflux transporter [Deltaproteobacteria bacterium]MBW2395895.1 MATE family efflux transporter [Deltaproteobacteria bacterium]
MGPSTTETIGGEARHLLRLALPVVMALLGTMMMGFVDTLMVGRVSVDALAAVAIANFWIFATLQMALGVLFGLDPIVAQAHGAGEGERAGLALQQGVVLAAVLSVLLVFLWSFSENVLLLMGQDPELAAGAHTYTRVQLPSVPFLLGAAALRQYLQARELVRPAMWVVLIANLWNVFFNWVFIFGHLGAPALGVEGAGIATSLTRILSGLALVALVWFRGYHLGGWVPWSRAALDPAGLRRLLSMGIPISVQMGLEMWAFSGSNLVAGWLGTQALAAHTIVLNLASITFMLPLGIAQGTAVRVGNLIGAGQPERARRASWVGIAGGGGIMTLSALLFVLLRDVLPRAYTPDAAVIALATSILPIAAAFQVFDGIQVVACGVLRGLGRPRPAAVFNLIGYWILGLPIGIWLALRTNAGLAGLWWGLAGGLSLVAIALLIWIARSGQDAFRETGSH